MTLTLPQKRVLAVCAALLAASTTVPAAAQERYVTADVSEVGSTSLIGGTVIPYKEVVLSAMVPGQVRLLAGREGDAFQQNALMVQIDDADLQARRRSAVAALQAAEAALRQAQVQYNRELISPQINRGMSRSTGMAMPQMFDTFFARPFSSGVGASNPWVERYADLHSQQSGMEQAQSQIMQARAQLEEIDTKIRDARVVAPFPGTIVARMIEEGDTVQPGQPLLKFAYVDYLRIQAEVPVKLVGNLYQNMFVPARLDVGGGIEVNARVAQIFPVADQSRHTVTVKFDLPRGIPAAPGVYAELRLPNGAVNATSLPTVPRSALIQRGSLFGVFVRGSDGEPTLKMVRVGGDAGDDRVTILSGLKGGEEVVVNPTASTGRRPNARAETTD
ncbi:efflux RND transporter periplasmic adaptor subunit [Rhodobium gokarnense]|uniref:Multidrug efflux pump subunit AcrA (Membrane-fusion protein) n=1 Tax=Rhodobium gokarnense TaxID=364296 RepID=A0ABT3H906_9HYPH|nr:efflux RND transporter periplasmic adaptor subunit [Rhodobium gokarnense]MCW2306844.1 multidrug efflux pump subunit AcrA (membrane-fusion protein) [Rhodobium gokarnense]